MIVRISFLACFLLCLVGCKIQISVPEGGHVTTQSGIYECLSGQTCFIEVTDILFDETFIAIPDPGYSFRWRQFPRGLCGGSQEPCHLFTSGFAGKDKLLALLASDAVFFLEPKFWTDDQPEIGGVGEGTITDFGSVIVNDSTVLSFGDDTAISIDDESADETELKLGMVLEFEVGDDVSTSDDQSSGSAISIAANHLVKGPVTSVAPLSVLSQTIVVSGTTVLDNLPGRQLSGLKLGDIVEVAGYRGTRNEILATRLEFKAGGVLQWKITGPVSRLQTGIDFHIADQQILVNNLPAQDCAGGLSNGDTVEVKADPDVQFEPGAALSTTTKIECEAPGLAIPDNPLGDKIAAEIEGVVSSITSPSQFVVGGQTVKLFADTEFRGGSREDLIVGVNLEAEGTLRIESDVLDAREIKFKQSRVRIEAPLAQMSAGAHDSIELLGIEILKTPVTEDEDGVFEGDGGLQVEVRGYVDSTGAVFAEELRDRGDSDEEDTRLRGPVSDIIPPTFKILGVLIDTSTAREIRDQNEMLIGSAEFFGLISDGSIVSVQDATYDGNSRLDQGKIEVED